MQKPIMVDLPYPSLEGITEDFRTAKIISSAYCGTHGELTATLQYIFHSFYFDYENLKDTAEVLTGIAIAEMKHFDILGETLLKLGVSPVYTANPPVKCNFFSTTSVSYSKVPEKMLMDNISGEMYAIQDYTKMINCLENEKVAALIARIRLDEELHVKVLKEQFEKLCSKSRG